jgi:hypothetical protein
VCIREKLFVRPKENKNIYSALRKDQFNGFEQHRTKEAGGNVNKKNYFPLKRTRQSQVSSQHRR